MFPAPTRHLINISKILLSALPVIFLSLNTFNALLQCWSQKQSGLRHRSTVACLLRSWAQIPPGHGCLSVVSVVCCQVEVSAMD